MEFLEQRKWNREEVLAVMGVPKSILSVDENLNYSIQLSQDKNFWNKCLIPIARIIEAVLDQTLLYDEPDTTTMAFDLSVVEALQEDIQAKATTAISMITTGRIPPAVAYDKVGIDLPKLPYDDVILVNPLLAPIDTVIEAATQEPLQDPNAPAPTDKKPPVKEDPVPPKGKIKLQDPEELFRKGSPVISFLAKRGIASTVSFRVQARRKAAITSLGYRRLIASVEQQSKVKWRSWVNNVRREQMAKFDEYVKQHGLTEAITKARAISEGDIEKFLFNAGDAKKALRSKMSPEYSRMADSVLEFTTKELGGVFVFDIGSEKAQQFIDDRVNKVTGVSDTVRTRLDNSIKRGIKSGEGVNDIRGRINRVFNNQISPGRATTIARTETAQTFGGVRDMIFDDEGVSQTDWTTSGDDHVREDHQTLGASGNQKRGFNYMELLGRGDETLSYPSDPEGPADQIINCRCVAIAVG
jgi:hypothetical protein